MFTKIIPTSLLTKSDLEKAKEFHRRRNLYNKYTLEQLEDWTKIDLYEALDLDCYRDKDIPETILQYAVKKKSATYHPTNNKGRQAAFFIVKRAEVILSSPKYRKVYDSCFLDESIPEDREYNHDEFFDIFSRVFDRNAMFSEAKPAPGLKDDPEVFYKFWLNFKTTRVYDDPTDVFDVSGSMRRHNADKNRDIMQQKKLRDLQRIQELVKLAIKRDPRIKKKSNGTSPWDDSQLKSLRRFDNLFGKTSNKFDVIAKKLNELFLTKRSPQEIKSKLDELKR
ncbi:uncharacterized protein VICG_01396 [Vittaforma corneae ATCC 50505]|uniref:Zuotin-like zuotin homology domain-containing protein n=1 Tax=Vittaforma corneae (strain ATCC 50505) TaxID=993615 RepID=L2GMK0_VITCO|nr:uncharacterized protein VICG_01396 [Vittaforma corneae ATCC 50505]ELA41532.1 hypothetical protein VICG_01396 [Vittaforma corneae ATCC 50505]